MREIAGPAATFGLASAAVGLGRTSVLFSCGCLHCAPAVGCGIPLSFVGLLFAGQPEGFDTRSGVEMGVAVDEDEAGVVEAGGDGIAKGDLVAEQTWLESPRLVEKSAIAPLEENGILLL